MVRYKPDKPPRLVGGPRHHFIPGCGCLLNKFLKVPSFFPVLSFAASASAKMRLRLLLDTAAAAAAADCAIAPRPIAAAFSMAGRADWAKAAAPDDVGTRGDA